MYSYKIFFICFDLDLYIGLQGRAEKLKREEGQTMGGEVNIEKI